MENIIFNFNELKRRGYLIDVGTLELREKSSTAYTRRQVEVDFIACKGSNKYYIQSAFLSRMQKKGYRKKGPFCISAILSEKSLSSGITSD